jgi:uncharacterized protein YfaS (alpha-2-macroglobulin family)/tetratricopeptide (TPR) repeat protein
MKTLRVFSVAVIVLPFVLAAIFYAADAGKAPVRSPVPPEVASAFQDRRYADAITAIDKLIASPKEDVELLLYLKGLAQFYDKKNEAALVTFAALEEKYPVGAWLHKARFKKAEAYAALRRFEEAEKIYESEAKRLLAQGRKDECAGALIVLADRLSAPKDELKPDSPAPDYPRAYELYKAALELEISPALRDDVTFKRAGAMHDAKNWNQAIQDYSAYLVAFDPDWQGAIIQSVQVGKHAPEARFNLADCYFNAGNMTDARRVLQDLVRFLDKKLTGPDAGMDAAALKTLQKLRADSMYRIAATYAGGNSNEVLLKVKALKDFIIAYPADDMAVQACFDIAAAYAAIGRQEDAVPAYKDFLDGKLIDASSEKAKDLRAKLAMEAKYNLGNVYLSQKKYDEAIAIWNDYIANHPTGPSWSACQQNIIEAEYRVGADLRAEKKYDEARSAWEKFLKDHPLDPRARSVMFEFGNMDYAKAEVLADASEKAAERTALYEAAVAVWQKLVSKYPETEESSHAQFMIGSVYEMNLKDLAKALEEYKKCTWGPYIGQARARTARMTNKELVIFTERVWRTAEPARVTVQIRNIEKLAVNIYRLDLEDYFRKMNGISAIETLDTLLISPDKSWEIDAKEYEKYKPIEQEIEIPFSEREPGAYAVRIAGGELQATTLVLRSDLDVIIKSSKKALLVFAENMEKEEPWPGVSVVVSDGNKIFFEGTTGEDGVLQEKFDELKSAGQISVFAVSGGNFASNLVSMGGLQFSTGLSPKGYLYTDRPAYRPGQTVRVRGIIRETAEGAYSFEKGKEYILEIVDSQGRVLETVHPTLGEFGTFSNEFALDAFAPNGTYSIVCRREKGPTFSGSFEVQLYKLEKMDLSFDLPQKILFRGEELKGKIIARYYYGEPVAGREIEYFLPDGRRYVGTTDEKGELAFSYDTADLQEEQPLVLRASIVGENVAAQVSAFMAIRAFKLSVSVIRDVYLSGESFDVKVKAVDVENKPVAGALSLRLLRRESTPEGGWAEVLVSEKEFRTDERNGEALVPVTLDKGGRYILRADGTDRFKNPITAQGQVLISDAEDTVKLRVFADRERYKVGETADVVLHSRLAPALALLTFEGEEIISYRIEKLAEGQNTIKITVGNKHFPNFALSASAMVKNKFYTASRTFTVERELKVAIKPDKESYATGEKAVIEIVATDQNDKPVAAELSLAMVDESLLGVFPIRLESIRSFFEKDARRQAELATASSCTFSYHPATVPVPEALISEKERLEMEKYEVERREVVLEEVQSLKEGVQAQAMGRLSAPASAPEGKSFRGASKTRDTLASGQRYLERMPNQPKAGFVAQSAFGRLDSSGGDTRLLRDASQTGEAFLTDDQSAAEKIRRAIPESAYWNPSIVTDNDGKAKLEIIMPLSITRWRLLAYGTTVETLVGENAASVVTKKDFFAELKLPSILTEGDSLRITARVHNLTDFRGDADLNLTLKSGKTDKVLTGKVEIAGKGAFEYVFEPYEIPAEDSLTVELAANADENSDTVAQSVPVRPWGIEFSASKSGLAENDQETFWLALPEDRAYSRLSMSIMIDAGLEEALIEAVLGRARLSQINSMHTQADTASDLLGVVSVMKYLQALSREKSPEWKLLSDKAQSLISSLVVTQGADGGWSWAGAPGSTYDSYTSSRALWALAEAKDSGIPLPDETFSKATSFLNQAFQKAPQEDNELKAAILHALAVAGKGDFGSVNRLYRFRESLSPAALVHTSLALALLDRKPMAAEVLDVLKTKRQALAGDFAGQCVWRGATNQAWMRSDDEMTALALLAYLKIRAEDPAVKEAVQYLLAHQPWSPDRAKGPALAALSLWFAKEKPAENNYQLTIKVNDREVKNLAVKGPKGAETIEVPAEGLAEGKNRVDILLKGRGRPHYLARLAGFSGDMRPPEEASRRFRINHRYYKAAPPEYKGKPVRVGFSTVHDYSYYFNKISQLPIGQVTDIEVEIYRNYNRRILSDYDYLVVREHIPAGATVLQNSINGNFDYYVIGDGEITFYVGTRESVGPLRYSLAGYTAGSFRVLPTIAESLYSKGLMSIGRPDTIEVLNRGEKSTDPYKPTPDELYYLGKAYFDDGNNTEAGRHLTPFFDEWSDKLNDEPLRETARMLLFVSIDKGDARDVVKYFEVLKEKYPELFIPFDKVLAVGKAYKEIEEFERAMLVYKATVAASFVKDANVAGVLERQERPIESIDFLKGLWSAYPDIPSVTNAYLALSDMLYTLAPKTGDLKELKEKKLTSDDLMLASIRILVQYLTLYPEDPTADDAALNLVNAYLKLEDYESTSELCRTLKKRYPDSPYLDSFEYVEALALWNLSKHDEAIALATKITENVYTLADGTKGPSPNRDLALYIVGQIWHGRGEPTKAIEFYTKVRGKFADAAEAIAYFEREDIQLEEVTTYEPGQKAVVALRYRNIPEAHLLVYKVDLMTLYLTEKNLNRITRVKLAGIHPALAPVDVKLGNGKDYKEMKKDIPLKIDVSGAYLVICRGQGLHASGMVLVTPLKLEVQEEKESGRVRVNIIDMTTGKYVKGVHCKIIGSESGAFIAGDTDLRGIFVADGIRGTATVIARDDKGQFAFYRGEEFLGRPLKSPELSIQKTRSAFQQLDGRANASEPNAQMPPQGAGSGGQGMVDYLWNVSGSNAEQQQKRMDYNRKVINTDQKGVQVEQVK